MKLLRELARVPWTRITHKSLLVTLLACCGGCSPTLRLSLAEGPPAPVNDRHTLLIDIVKAEGRTIRDVQGITAYHWFIDPNRREDFSDNTKSLKVEWNAQSKESQLSRIEGGESRPVEGNVLENYKVPWSLPGASSMPWRIFLFANYDLPSIDDEGRAAYTRKLELDPRETREMDVVIKPDRLQLRPK